jgi:peptidyl-prolyl cis-trans isomerase SurA
MHRARIVASCALFAALPALAAETPPAAATRATPAANTLAARTDLPGEMLDRIVAVVNDGVVLKSELDERVRDIDARMRERGVPPLPQDQVQEQVLDRLIIMEIQRQRADRLGITIDDDSLNRMLTTVAQRNGIAFDELPRALERQGINYDRYREESRRELQVEQLRARDVYSRINVTEGEIDAYMRQLSGRDDNIEYHLSHILVSIPTGATNDQIEEARKRAVELRERAATGEDFSRLAVAYSSGQQALQGGDLGWRKLSSVPTLFVDTVLRMSPGEVSDPIPSPSGFHLVRLDEKRGAARVLITQRHVRHILIAPNEVRSEAQAHDKIMELRARIEAGEDFAAIAREESDDHASASSGGDLGWSAPDSYSGEFEAALAKLAPGELSEPVHTEFGWHLIELLETREHDSTDEQKRNQALAELRKQKAEVETDRWERQLRDEAYVEIRL